MKPPAGLCDNNFEWFVHENEVWCVFHSRAVRFDMAPFAIKQVFMIEMAKDKEFMRIVGGLVSEASLEQYIRRHYSHLNEVPDYEPSTGSTHKEAINDNLTARELEVMKEVSTGSPDKCSCDHLGISRHTYREHIKHINKKLHLHSKVEITKYSFEHDIA
jgi:DNA-binding CsgD family transcriptional regulator